MKSNAKRSLAKTLTWRILATSDTFFISWLITGRFDWAGMIAGFEVMTKMVLYYLHERGWNKIKWGKQQFEFPTQVFPVNDWKIQRLRNYLVKKGNKRVASLLDGMD